MRSAPVHLVFLLALSLGSFAFGDALEDATRLFEGGKVQEAFERVGAILEKNPNQFPAQVLLFRIWLEKKLHVKAEEALTRILKARENEQTWMLAAEYWLAVGNPSKAKAYVLKVLDRDRRHVDALVLQAQIEDLSGYPTRAAQSLREAGLVRDDHEPWLYQQGLFYLKQRRFQELDGHLARYRKLFPESPRQFHLSSLRSAAALDWAASLAAIQKALYWKPEKPEYLEQLREVYFRGGKYRELVDALKKNRGTDRDAASQYDLAYCQYLLGRKGPWLMPDRNYNDLNLFPAIDRCLALDENNEAVRAFIEEIVLKNYPLTDPLREKYARFHRERVAWFLSRGETEKAHLTWLRLVRLVPQNLDDRLGYASFLKDLGWTSSYLEQLKLVRNFSALSRFEIEAKILINERRLSGSLERRYKLDPLAVDFVKQRVHLVAALPVDGKATRNVDEILRQMLLDRMAQMHGIQVKLQDGRPLETFLTQEPGDYYLSARMEEQATRLKVEFTLSDAVRRVPLEKKTFVTDGKEKFLDLLAQFGRWLRDALPPKGHVLVARPDHLVLGIGARDGLTPGQALEVYSGFRTDLPALGVLKPKEIEEYFCTAEIDKSDQLRFIKAGDTVVGKKK